MATTLEILPNSLALAYRAAHMITTQALETISGKDRFTIALSGGSTPRRLYELLANPNQEFRKRLPWEGIHFFWTDERPVGPDDPDSNYRMANEAMLSRVPVPEANVHRIMAGGAKAEEVAMAYESDLKTFFALTKDEPPCLDLVLLGMGADGHTASIFPGSAALHEERKLVAAPWVEKLHSPRITMTLRVLNNAAAVLFLVTGEEKAEVVRAVINGQAGQFPAQAINPASRSLTWLLDAAAASRLHDS